MTFWRLLKLMGAKINGCNVTAYLGTALKENGEGKSAQQTKFSSPFPWPLYLEGETA